MTSEAVSSMSGADSLRKYASREAHRASPGDVPSSTSGNSQRNGSKGSGVRPKSEGAERIGTQVGSGSGGLSLHSSKIGPPFLGNEELDKEMPKTARVFLTSSQI